MKCHLKYYILLKEEIIHSWLIQQKKGKHECVSPFLYLLWYMHKIFSIE